MIILTAAESMQLRACADAACGGVIQWQLDYDACDVLLGQVHVLLNQVSHGAGMSTTPTTFVYDHFCKRCNIIIGVVLPVIVCF